MLEKLFHLKENNTKVSIEVMAGLTTFFAMSYIIAVNPSILSQTGMEWGAVFIATILASAISTLAIGLISNTPYAQAPGMGLNALFTYTMVFALGFTWKEALAMVFISGVLNVVVTVTNLRKIMITCLPEKLKNIMGAGIGLFIIYIGLLNVGFIDFSSGVPSIASFNDPVLCLFIVGLIITIILYLKNVKGAILLGIVLTTIIGIPFGVTTSTSSVSVVDAITAWKNVVGCIFTGEGLVSLFSDPSRIPMILIVILTASLSDNLDSVGTFISTGRISGIFTKKDEEEMGASTGLKNKIDKAMFADSIATPIGAILGTSSTTTYVESAAGIGVGGRTGLTSVVVAICFLLSIPLASFVSAIPQAATAPALIIVGTLMTSSFITVSWDNFSEALVAIFCGVMMALTYSITNGLIVGIILYVIIELVEGKKVHPFIWVLACIGILNFILLAIL